MKSRAGRLVTALLACAFALSGCVTTTETIETSGPTAGGQTAVPTGGARPNPVGSATSVRVAVLPLGAVPYDDMTLPLVSPDAMFVASEVGVAPPWSALLAEPAARPPVATRVDVFRVYPGGRAGSGANEAVASRPGPALLGRSVSREGFLIEVPQDDGSRWIGLMSWATGDTTWLAADPQVNAFASLGAGGRLAWSRRGVDGQHFDLVVRHGDEEWVLPADGGDWLMPHWAGAGDGLFVLRLEGELLMLCHADATDPVAFERSRQTLPLADRASRRTAYQVMATQVTVADVGAPELQQLSFFHPNLRQAALWRPLASGNTRVVTFRSGSMFALPVAGAPMALVTTQSDLLRQPIGGDEGTSVISGIWIPRSTPAADWPYTALAPGEGRIGMTALQLLPGE